MKEIHLCGDTNLVAIVDDEDFDRISGYKWYPRKHRNTFYARANLSRSGGGPGRSLLMHSLVSGLPMVDHRDGNGLNNTKANLRTCTCAQNSRNKRKQPRCSSSYKGVGYDKEHRMWRVRITVDGHTKHLGRFYSEIDAAKAYDAAATKWFGEFARKNFS